MQGTDPGGPSWGFQWGGRGPGQLDRLRAHPEHGRAGVPLYLVYGSDGGPPVILPQLLTAGMVAEALGKAAAPPIEG